MAKDASERPRSRAETKAATRQALLEAGLQEFIERGQDRPSLDEICARAGFTRGAFYVHFEDREDFFVAVMEWALGKVLDAVLGPDGGDDDLHSTVGRFSHMISAGAWPGLGPRRLPIRHLMEAVGRSEVVRERFSGLFDVTVQRLAKASLRAQESGEMRHDIDAVQVSTLLAMFGFGALLLDDAGISMDAEQQRDALLQLLTVPR